jgi:hypothetical protein
MRTLLLPAWQERFDFDPPSTEFAVVGCGPEGKHPIHDRWIVAENSGLRVGSSLNSIGLTRTSDLSEIGSSDILDKWQEINIYFDRPPKLIAGEKVVCIYFTL